MKKLNRNIRVANVLAVHFRTALPAALMTAGICSALLFSPFVSNIGAQDQRAMAERLAVTKEMLDGRMKTLMPGFMSMMGTNRAVIGVTTSSGGKDKSDTAGVMIESVTPGSPADKAGIKAGSRITAVNGVNLKVSAFDADDPELQGIGQRRLIRELGKANPGDEVDLRVSTGSAFQSYKFKTVSPDDLNPVRSTSGMEFDQRGLEKRASIGATIGSTGSLRDTLGIFVSSVVTDGPAEKAGVIEGDRIAAINGVDVRVPREDAEDAQASLARVNRFRRELSKLSPGDKATLRVYGGGRFREVPVTTGKSAEQMLQGFEFKSGDGVRMMSLPRMQREGMPLEGMPMMIRSREGDSSRIVLRQSSPSVLRKVQSGTIRRSAQQ